MDAQLKTPVGMIRDDDLLNVLLAIWKMEYVSMAHHPSGFAKSHLAGVEEALQAVAQVTGLGGSLQRAKSQPRAANTLDS
jgi:hypothetical protein